MIAAEFTKIDVSVLMYESRPQQLPRGKMPRLQIRVIPEIGEN